MAEETEQVTTEDTETPDGAEVDYKALYEAEKQHKREWERRAKANRAAADELARAQEAGKTAEERIAELTFGLDACPSGIRTVRTCVRQGTNLSDGIRPCGVRAVRALCMRGATREPLGHARGDARTPRTRASHARTPRSSAR